MLRWIVSKAMWRNVMYKTRMSLLTQRFHSYFLSTFPLFVLNTLFFSRGKFYKELISSSDLLTLLILSSFFTKHIILKKFQRSTFKRHTPFSSNQGNIVLKIWFNPFCQSGRVQTTNTSRENEIPCAISSSHSYILLLHKTYLCLYLRVPS